MNQIQVKDYMNMIKYINLYLQNTTPDEIALSVFNSDELNDYIINYIEKLQNNFMNTQGSMQSIHMENLIKVSYAKYHKP